MQVFVSFLLLTGCDPTTPPKDTQGEEETGVVGVDADEDGWEYPVDCDDQAPTTYPGADEVCDAVDNDCDGLVDEDAVDATTWYGDSDGDGYGGSQYTEVACEAPVGFVATQDDCNDLDGDTHPGAEETCDGSDNDCDGAVDEDDATDAYTWYYDADGDGFGIDSDSVTACDPPRDYAAHGGDCDDTDASYHPGALEADCADPNDYNCDGSVGYADGDGDGFAACEDCDDDDADVSPDGVEICDDLDNDCDGVIDDDASDTTTWYLDADGDGFGGSQVSVEACEAPAGFGTDSTDCDDLDATSFPGGAEVCDDADNDCDGTADEGVGTTWYADSDGDGYGDASSTQVACDAPIAHVANGDDCDDASASTSPASYEICDGADNDCDGEVDEAGALNGSTFYRDADSDGYGTTSDTVQDCTAPSGYVEDSGDCNDADAAVSPAATEACDSVDNDCDGDIDEADASDAATWYRDADQDGYGAPNLPTSSCDLPSGFVADDTDCDDTSSSTNPGAVEYCDNVDNDCDSTVDETDAADALTWYADTDSDGYGDPSSTTLACTQPSDFVSNAADCDDTSSTSSSTFVDGDCDGTLTTEDCDDADSASTVVATDGDCDGTLTADDCDDANATSTTIATDADCDGSLTAADCNDLDAAILPGATEICDGVDNNCSGTADDSTALGDGSACAATDCQDILSTLPTAPSGSYWIDASAGTAFETHCEMDSQSGGWTLVMNVEPSDGNNVIYTNTTFWKAEAEYGTYGSHFTNDYKGPAAWKLSANAIMVQVANPGATGTVFGWKAWSMSSKTYDSFFDSGNNTTQTASLLGQDTTQVYTYEPLLAQGSHLRSNMEVNANGDRSRLAAESYSPHGDDNQPGLGTQMNGACCGDAHRNKDVELWVNSSSNLWCTAPSEGSYAWLGSDGTCGSSCSNSNCDSTAGPGYTPYWTYRIYVR